MTPEKLTYLLDRLAKDRLTDSEARELHRWYRSFDDEEGLTALLTPEQRSLLEQRMWGRIFSSISQPASPTGRIVRWLPLLAAAACLLGVLLWWGLYTARPVSHPPATARTQDAAPGGDKAYLTLSDGSVVPLDSAGTGLVASQGGVSIRRQGKGQLVYNEGRDTGCVYNSLSTPKGGQYRLTLPDGTMVWLNAATTLTYPTRFDQAHRSVTLKGEAYFEAARDPLHPLEVHTPAGVVTVLGTCFDVMAYADEPRERTTLLSGAIRVSGTLLRPGQQAALSAPGTAETVTEVDTAEAVAWKNGFFQFHDTRLRDILRQVSRWYDVDVALADTVGDERFRGRITRNVPLSEFLKILELNGVQFSLKGKTLTVR